MISNSNRIQSYALDNRVSNCRSNWSNLISRSSLIVFWWPFTDLQADSTYTCSVFFSSFTSNWSHTIAHITKRQHQDPILVSNTRLLAVFLLHITKVHVLHLFTTDASLRCLCAYRCGLFVLDATRSTIWVQRTFAALRILMANNYNRATGIHRVCMCVCAMSCCCF